MASVELQINLQLVWIEDELWTLDGLAKQIAIRLYKASRDGTIKIHERAIVTDMLGIRPDG